MKLELLTKRDAAITTHDEENVRTRAYDLYEVRGRIDGHAEEDWLQAEGELAGNNERKGPSLSLKDHLYDHLVESDAQTTGGKPCLTSTWVT